MNSSSLQLNDEFQCPLCLVKNRAAAKFCRKCGRPRDVLKQYVAPAGFEHASDVTSAVAPDVIPDEAPDVIPDASASNHNQPEVPINPECSGCASIVRSSDRFCCWCGEIQAERIARECRACPACSQTLPASANFCFQCGHAVAGPEKLRMRVPAELFDEESSEFFPTFEA